MFLSVLVKEMRKSLPEGFFGKGPGAGVYSGLIDEVCEVLLDLEHLYRSIRALRIYEGTTEIQHLLIGRRLLKHHKPGETTSRSS